MIFIYEVTEVSSFTILCLIERTQRVLHTHTQIQGISLIFSVEDKKSKRSNTPAISL